MSECMGNDMKKSKRFRWSVCSGKGWSVCSGKGWSICVGNRWSVCSETGGQFKLKSGGQFHRFFHDKFRPKYEKECFEIEQELNKSDGYFSNLKKVIDFAVKVCRNPLIMWNNLDFNGKQVFQNLLFPEGIIYNREFDLYRTTRVNTFFSAIPQLKRVLEQKKSGYFVNFDETSALVPRTRLELAHPCEH